jgi:hypothetical protein
VIEITGAAATMIDALAVAAGSAALVAVTCQVPSACGAV